MEKKIKIIDLLTDLFNYRETNPEWLPKRIRFNGEIFNFKDNVYCNEDNGDNIMLYVNHTLDLRVQAEILDEEDEFEDIEHYDMFDYFGGYDFGGTNKELLSDLQTNFEHINNELDNLIKNQKKIIERLNNQDNN